MQADTDSELAQDNFKQGFFTQAPLDPLPPKATLCKHLRHFPLSSLMQSGQVPHRCRCFFQEATGALPVTSSVYAGFFELILHDFRFLSPLLEPLLKWRS
jgi:hypothetical protein